ncbi:MAG: DUF934 domain-containing protein [Rhizobiaceae bacterium]
MTETTAPEMRLWTPQGFRDDEWQHGEDAEALASNSKIILPLQIVLGLDEQTRANAKARLGVLLMPGDPVEQIADLLGDLSLVALSFPAFSDGRSFSKAEILRRRYSFAGAVRAVGQVLIDQLPHMLRVGFDEFEVMHPVLLKRLEEGRLDGLPLYYQPSAKAAKAGEKYSWRRTPNEG